MDILDETYVLHSSIMEKELSVFCGLISLLWGRIH